MTNALAGFSVFLFFFCLFWAFRTENSFSTNVSVKGTHYRIRWMVKKPNLKLRSSALKNVVKLYVGTAEPSV